MKKSILFLVVASIIALASCGEKHETSTTSVDSVSVSSVDSAAQIADSAAQVADSAADVAAAAASTADSIAKEVK